MKKPLLTDEMYQRVKYLYVTKGLGVQMIQRIMNVSEHAVTRRLIADGLIRTIEESQQRTKIRGFRDVKDIPKDIWDDFKPEVSL